MSQHRTIIDLLHATDIFGSVPHTVLAEHLANFTEIRVDEGHTIIHKDDTGSEMFLIIRGEVKVHDGDVTVALLAEGDYFGEMSLLQPAPRSMSVSATRPTALVSINQSSFYQILGQHPELIQRLVGGILNRLRHQTIAMVDELRSRESELKKQVELQTALYKEQKERAERSEKFKQQFLANMSHEIRTPMNAVLGMTNLVLDAPLPPKQRFYVERIRKSSDILLHILNDILDLSKIEAGRMELEHIDFSLREVLEQVRMTLLHKADEKGLDLLVIVETGVADVWIGDPIRLNQVLINLAGNGIKFTDRGSVCIEVSKGRHEREIQFAVMDTGIGIPEGKLQSIFDTFAQANTSDTRKYGGTGLGLTISRELVELMGGTISVNSIVGHGTKFSIRIPFEPGSSERLQAREKASGEIDGGIFNDLRILVVDDNEYNRIVAQDTLESKTGATVVSVDSAKAALECLRSQHFDIVLMDVRMPDMNGFDATRAIRTTLDPPSRDIPVVALTASVLRTDLDQCLAAGMNDYIPKPFNADQLLSAIARALDIPLKRRSAKPKDSPAPAVRPDSVINLGPLIEFCEGDEAQIRKYIQLFIHSAPEFIRQLREGVRQNDPAMIVHALHNFKTRWVLMGMTECNTLAAQLEAQCRTGGDVASVQDGIGYLVGQVESAADALRANL